jgi:iron complex outermembrane receptor protein
VSICRLSGRFALITSTLVLSAVSIPLAQAQDAVVVTATRFPEKALEAPAGLSVISAERIAQSAATTLPELLAREVGITSSTSSNSPDRGIDMRGFGATGTQNTLVLLNGQRLNEIELTSVRWSSIPLNAIERIEVMRGSGAVLYGGGATGGTINIITKSPQASAGDASERATVGLTAGSFGTWESRLGLSSSGELLATSVNVNDYSSDNYRFNNRVEQRNVDGEIRALHSTGHIAFKFGLDNQSLRLPGERTAAQLLSDPRGTSRPGDYSSKDGHRGSLEGLFDLGFAELALDLGYRDSTRTAWLRDYAGGAFNSYVDSRVRVWSFTPRLRIPLQAGAMAHSLVVGLDADDWDYGSRRARALETLATPLTYVEAGQQNAAVYAQDNIGLNDSTKLTLGARQHYMRMTAHDRMNAAAYAKGAKTSFPRAWDVALRHELNRSTALFGRVGGSFRIATVDEIYSQFGGPSFDAIVTVLEPQTAFNQELGLEYRAGKFHARANSFMMQLNNEIHYFSPTFSNINLPPTEHKGMEFDAALDITSGLTLTGNLSMTDARFRNGRIGTSDVSGRSIPLVPREQANLGLAWKISDALQFSAAWKHVGVQYFDNDQTNTFPTRIPSYSTTDVKLTHRSGPATVALGVTNLLDRRYYSYAIRNGAGTSFNAYPERPRAIMLTLQYDLL